MALFPANVIATILSKSAAEKKVKKKQGPTQKLFLGLNMFVLCPFSGQHFTGKINDN